MATPEPAREEIFLPGGHLCMECISEPTQKVLCEALKLPRDTRWDSVRSPHIFMGLLAVPDPGVRTWVELLGADLNRLLRQLQEHFVRASGRGLPHNAIEVTLAPFSVGREGWRER